MLLHDLCERLGVALGRVRLVRGVIDLLDVDTVRSPAARGRVDASAHQRETGIRVDTKSHRELPAYAETKKKLDEAKANNVRPRM